MATTFSDLVQALTRITDNSGKRRLARLLLGLAGDDLTNLRKSGPAFGKHRNSGISTGALDFVALAPGDATIFGWWIRHDATSVTTKFIKRAGALEPAIGNSINTSGLVAATGITKSTTLSDFTTTAITADDVINAYITSITGTLTSFECGLLVSKT